MESNCGVCGGFLVKIRGKYPHTDMRVVCPTCLAEKMDLIKEYSDANYGKQLSSDLKGPIKLEILK